jgi:hypothetical protein
VRKRNDEQYKGTTSTWWSRVGGGLDVIQPGENRVLAGLLLLGAVAFASGRSSEREALRGRLAYEEGLALSVDLSLV